MGSVDAAHDHSDTDVARGRAWMLIRRIYRGVLFAALLSIMAVLIYKNVAPSGVELHYEIHMQAGEKTANIQGSNKLGGYSDQKRFIVKGTRMVSDQVAFTWKVPYGRFDRAEAKVRYRGDPEELLLGIKGGSSSWLETKPIHNRVLNELSWDRIEEKGQTLFQRDRSYNTIHDFLRSRRAAISYGMGRFTPPDLAAYYFDGIPFFRESALEETGALNIDLNLRGAHAAIIYVDSGHLELTFNKFDLNIYEGADNLTINIYREQDCVFSATMKDDGDASASYITSCPQEMAIELDGLQQGFYELVWDCGADVLFRDLRISCGYLSFLDRVFVAQGQLYGFEHSKPVALYTSATLLAAETWHAETLQEVAVNGVATIRLDEPGVAVTTNLGSGVKEIAIENPNLLLNAPGYSFAVSRGSLLIPSYARFSPSMSLLGIDYIIADYCVPMMREGIWEQQVEFELAGREMAANTIQLLVTSPGLSSRNEGLELLSIELKLTRDR